MKLNICGTDINIKPLDDLSFKRYSYFILEERSSVTERQFLQKATELSSVKYLFSLLSEDDVEIDSDNCEDIFYKLFPYIHYREVVLTGQEAYRKLMEKSSGSNSNNISSD